MIDYDAYEFCEGDKDGEPERESYLRIWGFMLTDLGLEKTELLVYALIFSVYYTRCDYFRETKRYIQQRTNSSRTSVDRALISLEAKKLIRKACYERRGIKEVIYMIEPDALPTCEMFSLENKSRDNRIKIQKRKESLMA